MRLLLVASMSLLAACSSSSSPGPTTTGTDSGSQVDDTGRPQEDATSDTTPIDDAPSTGDTWTTFAQGFFTKYCTECHDTSDPTGRDFTVFANVKSNAATIRCGVAPVKEPGCGTNPAPKQFPIDDATGTNPKPTDAERARIVAWIDAGLP